MNKIVGGWDVCDCATSRNERTLHTGEKMRFEKYRIESFKNWPKPYVDVQTLARNGFYYLGQVDLVKCNFCGVILSSWEADDVPLDEHMKYALGKCPFLEQKSDDVPMIKTGAYRRNPDSVYREMPDHWLCVVCDLKIEKMTNFWIDRSHKYWSPFCMANRVQNTSVIEYLVPVDVKTKVEEYQDELSRAKEWLHSLVGTINSTKNKEFLDECRKLMTEFFKFYEELMDSEGSMNSHTLGKAEKILTDLLSRDDKTFPQQMMFNKLRRILEEKKQINIKDEFIDKDMQNVLAQMRHLKEILSLYLARANSLNEEQGRPFRETIEKLDEFYSFFVKIFDV